MVEPARQRYRFDEYLRLEEESPVKHEFLEGHVWAMAGGTIEHAALCASVTAILSSQLRDRRCRVFSADLRVRVKATGLGTYPDATVVCDSIETDPEDPKGQTVVNPTLIVEVLSPSTESYDRGEKLEHYQRIPSLKEVVLVAHDAHRVEVWRRSGDKWAREDYTGDTTAELRSIECVLSLGEIYRDPLSGR